MKRKITALLLGAILTAGIITGCSSDNNSNVTNDNNSAEQTQSEPFDLNTAMEDLAANLAESYDGTSADIDTLNSFFSAIANTKFSICGVASNYNCSEYNGYQVATLTLTNDGKKYIISLKEADDSIKDGDYLQVEGKINSSISSDVSTGYGAFNLSNCTITARGDEVKDKVKVVESED